MLLCFFNNELRVVYSVKGNCIVRCAAKSCFAVGTRDEIVIRFRLSDVFLFDIS